MLRNSLKVSKPQTLLILTLIKNESSPSAAAGPPNPILAWISFVDLSEISGIPAGIDPIQPTRRRIPAGIPKIVIIHTSRQARRLLSVTSLLTDLRFVNTRGAHQREKLTSFHVTVVPPSPAIQWPAGVGAKGVSNRISDSSGCTAVQSIEEKRDARRDVQDRAARGMQYYTYAVSWISMDIRIPLYLILEFIGFQGF